MRQRCYARSQTGDLDGAIAEWTLLISLDPGSSASYSSRGYVRSLQSDVEGAIADFTKLIELDPEGAHWRNSAFSQRAEVRKAKGDLDGAVADYSREIDRLAGLNATFSGLYVKRGVAWVTKGDWLKARFDFDAAAGMAIREGRNDHFPLLCRYLARARLGEGDDAKAELLASCEELRLSLRTSLRAKKGDGNSKLAHFSLRDMTQAEHLKVVDFLLGNLSEKELLTLAGRGVGVAPELSQLRSHALFFAGLGQVELFALLNGYVEIAACQMKRTAFFFAGMARLISGSETEAANLFRMTLANAEKESDGDAILFTGRRSFDELGMAAAELARLERKKLK